MLTPVIDHILLVGFGGPTAPDEVEPFVRGIVASRSGPPPGVRTQSGGGEGDTRRRGQEARIQQVIGQYMAVGGVSPFNDWTMRQARALEDTLRAQGCDIPVSIGMRHWSPRIHDVLKEIAKTGKQHILCVALTAHLSGESRDKYVEAVDAGLASLGTQAPHVTWSAAQWYMSEGYLTALADHIQQAAGSDTTLKNSRLICTAHSIPQVANGCRSKSCVGGECCRQSDAPFYCRSIYETADALARQLNQTDYAVAFQSASGGPIPWIGPDVNTVIEQAAADGNDSVVVCPVGFICDHVEVLYDLDQQAAETARNAGLKFIRAETVGVHPQFITMLAHMIKDTIHDTES
jgi:protoporphyrin/coproporphyrin ferrochelatase